MAGESEKELENPADTIQHLRGIAERHLRQIDEEKEQDERDDLRRLEELQHYAKPRRRNKTADVPSSTSTTGPKMRSAQDVLDRLHWDDSLDASKYTIGYLERFTGIKEMPAARWISDFTDEEWIPQHRIKYFKQTTDDGNKVTVWDREKRIDRIFGSGLVDPEETDVRSNDGGVELTQ